MKITDLFGKYLRDTHEFLNVYEEVSPLYNQLRNQIDDDDYITDWIDLKRFFDQAHTILDQPMKEECLEMFKGECKTQWVFEDDHQIVMVCGKRFDDRNGWLISDKKFNDFVVECKKQNIPLELNENYHVHL